LGEKFLLHGRQNDYECESNVSYSTPPAAARGNLFPDAPWQSRNRCGTIGKLVLLDNKFALQKYITMHEGKDFPKTAANFFQAVCESQQSL